MNAYAEATKNVTKATVSLSDLEKASKSISSLASAFDEIFDKGHISLSTISEICDALELSGDELEKYMTASQTIAVIK